MMEFTTILFYILAVVLAVAALTVITSRDPVASGTDTGARVF